MIKKCKSEFFFKLNQKLISDDVIYIIYPCFVVFSSGGSNPFNNQILLTLISKIISSLTTTWVMKTTNKQRLEICYCDVIFCKLSSEEMHTRSYYQTKFSSICVKYT